MRPDPIKATDKKIRLYCLETEHGIVFVSADEFQDVCDRYNGAYGSDWKYNAAGDRLVFGWEDLGVTRTGSARVIEKAKRPVVLSQFELELQKFVRAGDTRKILEFVNRLK